MFKTASLHGDHAPCLKRHLWSFSKEKDTWTEEHKQLSEVTTSSNVSALRASFLLANHIAKTRKSFSEELILPVAKDIYWDLLGQAEIQKAACVPLSGSTIIRWTDEIAEDTEAQLSERINESTRLLSLPTFITRQQCLFLCDIYICFRRMYMRICYVHFCCQATLQLQNYASLGMITYQENGIGHFTSVYTPTEQIPWLPGFTTQIKEVTFECEYLHCHA